MLNYLSIDTADRQIFQLGYGIVAVLLNYTLGFLQVPAAGGHHFLIIRINRAVQPEQKIAVQLRYILKLKMFRIL